MATTDRVDESMHRVDFHGTTYILTLEVVKGGTALFIDVEQEETGSRWRGDFPSRYIEEITQKTGNYKRFPLFVKMLRRALDNASESVFVDLLTATDLEALKNRRSGRSGVSLSSSDLNSSARSSTKRYLILTYNVEFDKVHYPLPLSFEENPDPLILKRTIARLRREVGALKNGQVQRGDATTAETDRLRRIVEQLQAENTLLREQRDDAGGSRDAGSAHGVAEARHAYQRLKETSSREIARLKKDCRSLATKLQSSRQKQEIARERLVAASGSRESGQLKLGRQLRSLQKRLTAAENSLQREKSAHKRTKSRLSNELSKSKAEVKSLKASITRLRMKVRDASRQSRGRSRTRRPSPSPSLRSSVNSSTNSNISVRSRASTRSTRSTKSTRSAKTRRRTVRSNSPGIARGGASRKSRRRASSAQRQRTTRSPSPASGSRTASSRRYVRKSRRTRRVRDVSPYDRGYASGGSRASSADSRQGLDDSFDHSRRAKRSTRLSRRTRKMKKQTAKKKKKKRPASAGRRPSPARGSPAPPAPSAPAPSIALPGPARDARVPLGVRNGSSSPAKAPMAKTAPSSTAAIDSVASEQNAPKSQHPFNANSEMADIDRRLNALQDFLRQAKQAGGAER